MPEVPFSGALPRSVIRRLRLRRVGDRGAAEESHGEEGADPGAGGGEADVHPILGVADDGEGGEQVPDAAPGGCRDALVRGNGMVEENVDGIGGGCGQENAKSQPRLDLRHMG
jgi:hypothetical protein